MRNRRTERLSIWPPVIHRLLGIFAGTSVAAPERVCRQRPGLIGNIGGSAVLGYVLFRGLRRSTVADLPAAAATGGLCGFMLTSSETHRRVMTRCEPSAKDIALSLIGGVAGGMAAYGIGRWR